MTVYSMDDETERRLLANDPTVTAVSWHTYENNPVAHDASRVVAALRQSTHLHWLFLELDVFDDEIEAFLNGEETVIEEMVDWIKTSPALTNMRFSSPIALRASGTLLFPVFVDSILSRNQRGDSCKSVSNVTLSSLDVKADDLATLMLVGGLEGLTIKRCTILSGSYPTEAAAIQHVVESLADNTSLSDLSLDVTDSNVAFLLAMLFSLQSKTTVTSLKVTNHSSSPLPKVAMINALVDLFNTSICPLKQVKFDDFKWTEASMAPFCQCLRSLSMPIEEITLLGGSMDVESCALLQSIFGNVIPRLCIDGMVQFPTDNNHQALQRLVGHCTCPSSDGSGSPIAPTRLALHDFTEPEQQSQFRAVLRGLTFLDCHIRWLGLFDSLCNAQLEALIETIPLFIRVCMLSFEFKAHMRPYKERLMTAFRNNHTLLNSIVSGDGWDEADEAQLQVYQERNRALIPIALLEAEQTGSSTTGSTGQHKGFGGSILPNLFATTLTSNSVTKPAFISFALSCMEDGIGLPPINSSKRRVADLDTPQSAPCKRCKLG